MEIFHIFGKAVSTSFRIKKLPSIAMPCTDLDIYPQALSVDPQACQVAPWSSGNINVTWEPLRNDAKGQT